MESLFYFLQDVGIQSLNLIWLPILIWTAIAIAVFSFLTLKKSLNPIYHYHIRVATLFALPLGLIASLGMKYIPQLTGSTSGLDNVLFVIGNPLNEVVIGSNLDELSSSINFFDPMFALGLSLALLILVAIVFLVRFISAYQRLRTIHSRIEAEPLRSYMPGEYDSDASVAFHEDIFVPFTYGWRKPVIVLPTSFKTQEEHRRMAIKHELIHIERGDYILQLALAVIKSIFWFHPLVNLGNKKVELYREISCDQAVLNEHKVSLKKYAHMLYELAPMSHQVKPLSVSMAVQQSLLKQRISNMKYYSLYSTSLKRSVTYLVLISMFIITPIACSDLETPTNQGEADLLAGVDWDPANRPLIVVKQTGNNKYMSFEEVGTIDPKDVASINFFKKEESPGIFGSAAKNGVVVITVNPKSGTRTYSRKSADAPIENNGETFIIVEQQPELIGGLRKLQEKVQYPEIAKKAGIQGRVIVQFVVDKNGEVKDPVVTRSLGGGADEEALRVLEEAVFKPGLQKGVPVNVQVSLPFYFKLID